MQEDRNLLANRRAQVHLSNSHSYLMIFDANAAIYLYLMVKIDVDVEASSWHARHDPHPMLLSRVLRQSACMCPRMSMPRPLLYPSCNAVEIHLETWLVYAGLQYIYIIIYIYISICSVNLCCSTMILIDSAAGVDALGLCLPATITVLRLCPGKNWFGETKQTPLNLSTEYQWAMKFNEI